MNEPGGEARKGARHSGLAAAMLRIGASLKQPGIMPKSQPVQSFTQHCVLSPQSVVAHRRFTVPMFRAWRSPS